MLLHKIIVYLFLAFLPISGEAAFQSGGISILWWLGGLVLLFSVGSIAVVLLAKEQKPLSPREEADRDARNYIISEL